MAAPILPIPNQDSKEFWDGCAHGRLLLQRCASCGALRHPPSPICSQCLSLEHDWIESSGQGTIYAFVVVREPVRRGWEGDLPFVVAVVELREGPRMLSNIVNADFDRLAIGMPVEVLFQTLEGTTKLPVFQPTQPLDP